ncbi:MotA/TolQ/ExbB proton channel family protein [Helicobacter sp.]|uniref:MotA/TolQ/ExbB proton channel family protein n=1 Tax=Helicobacter sp. TaxID=218 RepID=UPI0025B98BEC|nr:MotA/TolQ/ExbB proton channel family protein [Helicobacter sp.]MCI5968764.1 MotA/TolQ/ExbB proton channel family protein [Helicobacter sp.]MDY2584588.1 MotA/TolQ/ExbB proton channel family protein [Helicobacter sp.]
MNFFTLLDNYGVITIVVLSWLSLYFILVLWIFIYRYSLIVAALSYEKRCLETLLGGRNTLPQNSLLGSNLIGVDKKLTEPMLQYALDKAIKDVTIGLTFLAIVASTAPFIGLFGTVVEILEAFSKLGENSKATLDVIAPVISKALVATAAGILTAIPAYSFNLFLKRKVFELSTYLQLQINVLVSPKT